MTIGKRRRYFERICDAKFYSAFASRRSNCILNRDHVGPHWGPVRHHPGRYQEWPLDEEDSS